MPAGHRVVCAPSRTGDLVQCLAHRGLPVSVCGESGHPVADVFVFLGADLGLVGPGAYTILGAVSQEMMILRVRALPGEWAGARVGPVASA